MSDDKGIIVSQKVLKWIAGMIAVGTIVFGTGAWMSSMSHGVQKANEQLAEMNTKIEKNNSRYQFIVDRLSSMDTRISVIEEKIRVIEGIIK